MNLHMHITAKIELDIKIRLKNIVRPTLLHSEMKEGLISTLSQQSENTETPQGSGHRRARGFPRWFNIIWRTKVPWSPSKWDMVGPYPDAQCLIQGGRWDFLKRKLPMPGSIKTMLGTSWDPDVSFRGGGSRYIPHLNQVLCPKYLTCIDSDWWLYCFGLNPIGSDRIGGRSFWLGIQQWSEGARHVRGDWNWKRSCRHHDATTGSHLHPDVDGVKSLRNDTDQPTFVFFLNVSNQNFEKFIQNLWNLYLFI